jgi:hypothetical protein
MRQVGHLPELHEDARSEKTKIFGNALSESGKTGKITTISIRATGLQS